MSLGESQAAQASGQAAHLSEQAVVQDVEHGHAPGNVGQALGRPDLVRVPPGPLGHLQHQGPALGQVGGVDVCAAQGDHEAGLQGSAGSSQRYWERTNGFAVAASGAGKHERSASLNSVSLKTTSLLLHGKRKAHTQIVGYGLIFVNCMNQWRGKIGTAPLPSLLLCSPTTSADWTVQKCNAMRSHSVSYSTSCIISGRADGPAPPPLHAQLVFGGAAGRGLPGPRKCQGHHAAAWPGTT